NLRALLEVLLGDLGKALAEDDNAMPLGLFAALAGRLVAPGVGGGDPQVDDRTAVLGAADFRVRAKIADQNDFVDAACHRSLLVLSVTLPRRPPGFAAVARRARTCPRKTCRDNVPVSFLSLKDPPGKRLEPIFQPILTSAPPSTGNATPV